MKLHSTDLFFFNLFCKTYSLCNLQFCRYLTSSLFKNLCLAVCIIQLERKCVDNIKMDLRETRTGKLTGYRPEDWVRCTVCCDTTYCGKDPCRWDTGIQYFLHASVRSYRHRSINQWFIRQFIHSFTHLSMRLIHPSIFHSSTLPSLHSSTHPSIHPPSN
jgi:hypothetical protein